MSDAGIDFFKGNYFVRIRVDNLDPPDSTEAAAKFASNIDQKIQGEAVVPELAGLFPKGYLVGSLKYFSNLEGLNQIYDLGDEDILLMSSGGKGMAAA